MENTKWICGRLKVNQGAKYLNRNGTPTVIIRRPEGSTRKIPGSSQNLSDIAKPVKNLPFPVLRLFLAGPERRVKSCDICKFTRELLQIFGIAHRTGPSHHLFRMEAKNDDRSPSFGEKSGGSALRNQGGSAFAQIHTLSPGLTYHLNLCILSTLSCN